MHFETHIWICLLIFAACRQQLCTYSEFLRLRPKTELPLPCRPDLTLGEQVAVRRFLTCVAGCRGFTCARSQVSSTK